MFNQRQDVAHMIKAIYDTLLHLAIQTHLLIGGVGNCMDVSAITLRVMFENSPSENSNRTTCYPLFIFQGSFAGLAIMFVTPGLLVLCSRDKLDKSVPHWRQMHHHKSPFQQKAWVYLMLAFAAFVLMTRIF